ncbi:hypothetical protein PC116_g17355 [Phytophthora cactorum]|nr:hypothetical protein PC116_g17355 [Phytophthora cactorum]
MFSVNSGFRCTKVRSYAPLEVCPPMSPRGATSCSK